MNPRELVPRQPVGTFGPVQETSGNEDAASPAGKPLMPALFNQSPSMVAFVIGTHNCEKL